MATVDDLTDVRSNENSSADVKLSSRGGLWAAPPLAPSGDEDDFYSHEPSVLSDTSGARTKLIAGTAVVVALGAAALAYFFLASPGVKPPAETAESSPLTSSPTRAASSSETQLQPAPTVVEPSPGASGVGPSPDVPSSLTAEAPQIAPSTVTPPTTSAPQIPDDLVFLQRPGVNIRSAPAGNAPVLGTAPMGTQFTATGREGDWVRVENTRLKGWINSQFLAPDKPR
jgi:hypothetical protein